MSDIHVEAVERPVAERAGWTAWLRTLVVCALLVAGLMALLPFMPARDHDGMAVAATTGS